MYNLFESYCIYLLLTFQMRFTQNNFVDKYYNNVVLKRLT